MGGAKNLRHFAGDLMGSLSIPVRLFSTVNQIGLSVFAAELCSVESIS